jgi:hypothetical protein
MAPRALIDNSHNAFSAAEAHLAVGSNTKKGQEVKMMLRELQGQKQELRKSLTS